MIENTRIDKELVEDVYKLSPIQEGLLFHYLTNPKSPIYLSQTSLIIYQSIDIDIFQKVWQKVIKLNPLLRTVFRWENISNPVQITLKEQKLDLTIHDLSEKSSENQKQMLDDIKKIDQETQFNIDNHAFRITLCKLGETCNEIIITCHHIIYDGWSFSVIVKEFFEIYDQLIQGKESISIKKSTYKDYVKWLDGIYNKRSDADNYWTKYLEHYEIKKCLDISRNDEKENIPFSIERRIDHGVIDRMNNIKKECNCTIASILYLAWGVLLQQYGNTDDVVFGTVVSGRSGQIDDIDQIVGLFINTIPFRLRCNGTESIKEVLHRTMKDLILRQEYETVPYVKTETFKQYTSSLYDTILVIENYPIDSSYEGRYKVDSVNESDNYNISIIVDAFDQFKIRCDFNAALYMRDDMEQLIQRYIYVLSEIVQNIDRRICDISILSPEETYTLENKFFHGPKTEYNKLLLHQYFERTANENPDDIAVKTEQKDYTYQEINCKANCLAHYLRKLGVQNNCIIAVEMQRSVQMIIALLGILKAGGGYLPIDVKCPDERLKSIVEDSEVQIIIADSDLCEKLVDKKICSYIIDLECKEIYMEDDGDIDIIGNLDSIAYVIYTSGSTGRPKGVMVQHKAIVNRILWFQSKYPINNNDIILQKTSYTFDVSVWELFWWSFVGAKVYLLNSGEEKDPEKIIQVIEKKDISVMHFVPSMFQAFLEYLDFQQSYKFDSLKHVFTSGEALTPSTVLLFQKLIGKTYQAKLHNLYGPTEAAIDVTYFDCLNDKSLELIPIGKPIDNITLRIIDKFGRLQPVGVAGELCISGIGLAKGYLNREDLTKEKFIRYKDNSVMYKTGDLCRWMPDTNIEYLGRMDKQVKIRGFRIELGEIENLLMMHNSVQQAVVLDENAANGNKILVAYMVAKDIDLHEIKEYLHSKLPDYMVPSAFVLVEQIPVTLSGKTDKNVLKKLKMEASREVSTESFDNYEQKLYDIWSEILNKTNIKKKDNFFDIGANSLHMIHAVNRIQKEFQKKIGILDIFSNANIEQLAYFLGDHRKVRNTLKVEEFVEHKEITREEDSKDIAIIGMSIRFPDANNIEEFWKNLREGKESIRFFDHDELLKNNVSPEVMKKENYVNAGAVIDDIDMFDADFFDINPKDAQLMDPQQRIFMECAWEAIEDAGYDIEYYGDVGVYAGIGINTYAMYLRDNINISNDVNNLRIFLNNGNGFLSTKVSYYLNLSGPSMNIETACSSSLVAVHMACQALLNQECSMALAGGVSIRVPQKTGYMYEAGGIFSPNGQCRVFDENACGTVGGNGSGVILLKKKADAIKDRDHIYAIIKSTAINNDGKRKAGYTAPSIEGQTKVISAAIKRAKVNPSEIGYVEAHGTGTAIGDPIEIEGLKNAYSNYVDKKGYCAIGSVKANIGHLDSAAGIAGMIKTALILDRQVIPKQLFCKSTNKDIDFENSPFYICRSEKEFTKENTLKYAAVSSFGMGGTNVHAILEKPPVADISDDEKPFQLIQLSAKTESALSQTMHNLSEYMKRSGHISISALAYTLQVGRVDFPYRCMCICKDKNNLIQMLDTKDKKKLHFSYVDNKKPVVFVFPGTGEQYLGMGKELYENVVEYRQYFDQCADLIQKMSHLDIVNEMFGHNLNHSRSTLLAHCMIFVTEYSLAKVFMEWNIIPEYMIGYSIGEYVASCISGVLTLNDALFLIQRRAELIEDMPSGAMIAVGLSEERLQSYLNKDREIAISLAENIKIVAGTEDEMDRLQSELSKDGIMTNRIHVKKAFHTSQMKAITEELNKAVKTVKKGKISIPYISDLTGTWMTMDDVNDEQYWSKQICSKVQFHEGMNEILEKKSCTMLEVGPGTTLGGIIKQNDKYRTKTMSVIETIGTEMSVSSDYENLLSAMGALWLNGITPNWSEVYQHSTHNRISLPGYPFERKRYWIDDKREKDESVTHTESNPKVSHKEDELTMEQLSNLSSPMDVICLFIKSIWSNVLGIQMIDYDDNFFTLRGNSLLATKIISELRSKLFIDITIQDFLDKPTIHEMAKKISSLYGSDEEAKNAILLYEQVKDLSEEDLKKLLDEE